MILRFRSGFLLFLACFAGIPSFTGPGLRGQEEVEPILRGEVRAAREPIPGIMVMLHRVSSDFSGEIDSIRSGADGRFSLRLPRLPDHAINSDIFFASVRYRGLLYFGSAITSPAQLDSLYLIQAYDTLAVPPGGADIPVAQRSLFLDKVETGWQATDVFQLLQEEEKTLFSPDEGVTWSYPLPPGARDFQVGQSEIAPDATRFVDGRMDLYSPIAPGERFYLVRYSIPEDEFTLPLPGTTRRLEVMVREPGPDVAFPPLTPGVPVELEPGNVFRRFEGVNLQDTEIVAGVQPPAFDLPAAWLAILLAGVLGGAGVWAYRRQKVHLHEKVHRDQKVHRHEKEIREEKGIREEAPVTRETLMVAIAALDEGFESLDHPSQEARRDYEVRRRALLHKLTHLP